MYPFHSYDIIKLLDLKIRHRNESSVDVNCPFCGDTRGKMNIHLKKEVYRCNYCDKSGNLVTLYADFYGMSNKTAYGEICERLHKPYTYKKQYSTYSREEKERNEIAPLEVRHKTYGVFLSLLTLKEEHRKHLECRGLTKEQIEFCGFKSTPEEESKEMIDELLRQNCTLKGVPGFYLNTSGNWAMNFKSSSAGILIPICSIDKRIEAFQIRLNQIWKNGTKYIWYSSTGKKSGTSSGSPVHFMGNPNDTTIYVTEGGLKATVAHYLSGGKTFMAVAGANHYKNTIPIFKQLKENGTKRILLAYDMDRFTNIYVMNGYKKLLKLVACYPFFVQSLVWDKRYKGIDDILLQKR